MLIPKLLLQKKKSAQIDTQFKLIDRNLINTCYYG